MVGKARKTENVKRERAREFPRFVYDLTPAKIYCRSPTTRASKLSGRLPFAVSRLPIQHYQYGFCTIFLFKDISTNGIGYSKWRRLTFDAFIAA